MSEQQTKKVWDREQDGEFYGDMEGHREIVEQRIREVHGNDVECQFSHHGAGRHSVQVFSGDRLVTDFNI